MDNEDSTAHVISTRANGDFVYGLDLPFAEELYSRGTPPVWGLAKAPASNERVASVQIGDSLDVVFDGKRWGVSDQAGLLGHLRWRLGDREKRHAVTGVTIKLPDRGLLHVTQLTKAMDGTVIDIGGYVDPVDH